MFLFKRKENIMTKKSKMDRGLDSLFFDNSIDEISEADSSAVENDGGENGISTVRISLIEPDKNQPRSEFDEDALNELAENIRQHGVLQPILVRPLDNGGYKIVAGERRWRAARLAGLEEIPVYIKELTDLEAAEISLIENIQRKDLTPLEEAAAYETLMETYGLTQQQVAEAVGRSRSAVANSVRLLSLSENVQEMLRDKKLTEGHAKVLAGVADKDTQEKLAVECIEKSWTVRELEKAIAGLETKKKAEKKIKRTITNPMYTEFEIRVNQATDKLRVSLSEDKKGGSKLDVKFSSDVDVDKILNALAELLMNC